MKTTFGKRLVAVSGLLLTLSLLPATVHAQPSGRAAPSAGSSAGPFATLFFSRTEMTAADNCVENDAGIARPDTVALPLLKSLRLRPIGSLVTAMTKSTSQQCTHWRETLEASWTQATDLKNRYGWSFISHTATYPAHLDQLTPDQAFAETCGSARALDEHGLPGGHGMIAYPGAQSSPQSLQAHYSVNCFAWGRQYVSDGTTTASAGSTPPYWQHTKGLNGGPCNDRSLPCYSIKARGSGRYDLPSTFLPRISALAPGTWFTLQAYILVTGKSPAYTKATAKWDCTSPDPRKHWSNDNERYCYTDWRKLVTMIAARPDITVTDPLTVGIAFGRPATYPAR